MDVKIVAVPANVRYDLTGQRFNRLSVLGFHSFVNHRSRWVCRCDCGKTLMIDGGSMKTGNTTSCGCAQRDAVVRKNFKHGMSHKHPLYKVWKSMNGRCNNPHQKQFSDYGGRGITVCERWRDFTNFIADMGERPPGMTIDRIDNSGNYEPGNCRWATKIQQANNTRTNAFLTYGGETKSVAEWARAIGVSCNSITMRIRRGASTVEALTFIR